MLPVVFRTKSFGILTPVTASLKVTAKSTLVALVVVANGFKRVMDAHDGYHGYSNPGPNAKYLTSSEATFHVPDRSYFALGDNSYNSSDSRYWGLVPEENLVGRGVIVYWPFAPHWGFIR